jgi:hypothetical protein
MAGYEAMIEPTMPRDEFQGALESGIRAAQAIHEETAAARA